MPTNYWIRAEFDGDSNELKVSVHGSHPYGPEGNEREAVLALPVNFDPEKDISVPKSDGSVKGERIAKAICPSQLDSRSLAGKDLWALLRALLAELAPILAPHVRRAAALANHVAETRGEFDE